MAIGLGTALAIGAISSAAGSGASAVIKAKGASKAAKQQQAGAQQAANYQREGLGQLRQLYSPYVNSGAGAMTTLGQLTTPGPAARFASPGPANAMPQPGPYGQEPPQRFAMPRGGGGPQGGPPMDGPYMMARGGDMMVNRPTMFIAGEAGPERATFSGAQGQPRPMMPPGGMPRGNFGPAMGGMAMMGQARPGGGDPTRDALVQKYAPRPSVGGGGMPPGQIPPDVMRQRQGMMRPGVAGPPSMMPPRQMYGAPAMGPGGPFGRMAQGIGAAAQGMISPEDQQRLMQIKQQQMAPPQMAPPMEY